MDQRARYPLGSEVQPEGGARRQRSFLAFSNGAVRQACAASLWSSPLIKWLERDTLLAGGALEGVGKVAASRGFDFPSAGRVFDFRYGRADKLLPHLPRKGEVKPPAVGVACDLKYVLY